MIYPNAETMKSVPFPKPFPKSYKNAILMSKLKELEENVLQWAEDRGIFDFGTLDSQVIKTLEEVDELNDAISDQDEEGIIDGIGDTTVTLIILAKMAGVDLEHCLKYSYDVIAKRTGKMVDGQFVKDE